MVYEAHIESVYFHARPGGMSWGLRMTHENNYVLGLDTAATSTWKLGITWIVSQH